MRDMRSELDSISNPFQIIRVHSFVLFSRAQVFDLRMAIATDRSGSDRAHHASSRDSETCVVLGHQLCPRRSEFHGFSPSISDYVLVAIALIARMRLLRVPLVTGCERACFCRDR